MKKTVYLAMSGGVDSAVAGHLLMQKGYNVVPVFMKIWSEDEGLGCPWIEDRRDALEVCAKLGLTLKTVDFEQEYKEEVFSYFVQEYKAGRTPNPDILCNEVIKFGVFLEYALKEGADYIATGHHARRYPEDGNDESVLYEIHRGIDKPKDQSYFLSGLNQYQVRHSLFPIGNHTKEEVRDIARTLGLDVVSDKRSTRGICFIGNVNLKDFLSKYTVTKPGDIVDVSGNVLGKHDGVAFYTIGQRKGLEIGAQSPNAKPYFVLRKDPQANQLIISDDQSLLLESSTYCTDLHWIDGKIRQLPLDCDVQIRYNQAPQAATLSFDGQMHQEQPLLQVAFEEPQRAVTPGQFCVVYDGDHMLGNAIIA